MYKRSNKGEMGQVLLLLNLNELTCCGEASLGTKLGLALLKELFD